MATHSSVLAWRIPGMGEPGGLPSMGRTESDISSSSSRMHVYGHRTLFCIYHIKDTLGHYTYTFNTCAG